MFQLLNQVIFDSFQNRKRILWRRLQGAGKYVCISNIRDESASSLATDSWQWGSIVPDPQHWANGRQLPRIAFADLRKHHVWHCIASGLRPQACKAAVLQLANSLPVLNPLRGRQFGHGLRLVKRYLEKSEKQYISCSFDLA